MTDLPFHPQLFIFNVSKASSCRQTCDNADAPHLFLPSFASALESAREHNSVVQGAIYGPEGASIFIDTDDENWERVVGIARRENIEKKLSAKVLELAQNTPAQRVQVSASQAGAQNIVSIFKVGKAPQQHIVQQSEGDDAEPQSLLKAFVEAIYSLVNQGARVEGAMYGAEEGAKIFIKDDWS